jgi:cellobiose phosphorylase
MKPATIFSRSGMNFWLRKRSDPYRFTPLLGDRNGNSFAVTENGFFSRGSWEGLDYECSLLLSPKSLSWQWFIDVVNHSGSPAGLDLFYIQDTGLKQAGDGLVNEYYVSQYLERRILDDQTHGAVAVCRQNMKECNSHPWLMIACLNGAASACTDGMQFYGKTCRYTGIPEGMLADGLGGEYAGESALLALQSTPFELTAGGDRHRCVFIGTCLTDHPEATSEHDPGRLAQLRFEFDNEFLPRPPEIFTGSAGNVFSNVPYFPSEDLSPQELTEFFGPGRRHEEWEDGRLLSFFTGQHRHVVLKAKEVLADRPHGQILQARTGLTPHDGIISDTCYASGIFNSHVSQGNTNFNILLSISTSQFNLEPSAGQRIIVEMAGLRYLLGVPSAFEMGLSHCQWIYKYGSCRLRVRSWTSPLSLLVNLSFEVLGGSPVGLTLTQEFDPLNGWRVYPGNVPYEYVARPAAGSMIAEKFPEARFRMIAQGDPDSVIRSSGDGDPLFLLQVDSVTRFAMILAGEVNGPAGEVDRREAGLHFESACEAACESWRDLSLDLAIESGNTDLAAIREILPWFGLNALTHLLTPYGLEQFSGAAWGTRDVSQGPVDLLLGLVRYAEAREVLRIIFSNQHPDGGWPQWWMFDRYSHIRADSAHGDILYWCLMALAKYIRVTGDTAILDEKLPYFQAGASKVTETTPLSEHVDRLTEMIVQSFIPGTSLVPFGGGDWNDSLQPVSRELARRMISSWTVEMNYQAFNATREIWENAGRKAKAGELQKICDRIRSDFNKYLVRDGVVAGYGLVEDDGKLSLLLHPSDIRTGIRYSVLPMERGILSGIFTPEQAARHSELIELHLKGPDGVRLMDRPLKYRGGIQTIFQRAESSTYFGREIGLMYVHEHIRYAESLARTGQADAFVMALRQANPVAYREVVPAGDIRQSNCYYSSSDVAFRNRYEADEVYESVLRGDRELKGGWRIYSSGPGIYVNLVISALLGIRPESGALILDPVIPFSMDDTKVTIKLFNHRVVFHYSVKECNFGPKSVTVNGKPVRFSREENPYRTGGAMIQMADLEELLDQPENEIRLAL